MAEVHEQTELSVASTVNAMHISDWDEMEFRREMAFPELSSSMLSRMIPYGAEKTYPENAVIYSYGETAKEFFVILDGAIDIHVKKPGGGQIVIATVERLGFTGEFNILSAQRAVVELRTTTRTKLLCIARDQFRTLMRSEGDIANLVVQAAIWRRIGILKEAASGVTLAGDLDDPETLYLRRFLIRNTYPYRLVAPDRTESKDHLPSVRLSDGQVLHRPSISQLADSLGITTFPSSETVYDVAVVGAGPSGLAASVYAASEGLATVAIEGFAPGGQAGTSSKIENYLGFPTGIGGLQLAGRAHLQALKFGVTFAISRELVTIRSSGSIHTLVLAGGESLRARSVVVATGAKYRKLSVENYQRYENCGLYYAATPMEAMPCKDKDVIVVGGGNSAGQASMFLSGIARHVYHLVRASSLSSTMSDYLISRIGSCSNITVCTHCEITALEGSPSLQRVTWVDRQKGEVVSRDISRVFVMIGADPNTAWLNETVSLDEKGFIQTGAPYGFEPTPYATSSSGIYAVGDVRSASVKRVASAVGEGSVVISDIHQYLTRHPLPSPATQRESAQEFCAQ